MRSLDHLHRHSDRPPFSRPWIGARTDRLRQDLAAAWRSLRRHPAFALTAACTLALGIGASTAMFSLVRSVVLRPLPYREPQNLVTLSTVVTRAGDRLAASSHANIDDWRRASRTLGSIAAYDGTTVVIEDTNGARRAEVTLASPELFTLLGVSPLLGRTFTSAESEQHELLAVLSHAAWQQFYGADPSVVGRAVVIDGRPFRIVGVMPPEFSFPSRATDFWIPESAVRGWDATRLQRGTDSWRVVARLAPDATFASAQRELGAIAARLAQDHPAENAGLGVRLQPLAQQVTGRSLRLALTMLAGAVGAVLLIACSNVASLFLVRNTARQREFAVRAALGASRTRLVGQLLNEALAVALSASVLGGLLAAGILHALRVFGPASIPRLDEIQLDGAALAFAAGLSSLCAIAFGLLPALQTTTAHALGTLRSTGAGSLGAAGGRRWRGTIVVTQFALALALAIAAGLLGRSFARLLAVDTGFVTERAFTVSLQVPPHRPAEQISPLIHRIVARVRELPGVRAAGCTEDVTLGLANEQVVATEGGPEIRLPLNTDAVTPGYFRAAGVALRRGRFFTDADDRPLAPPVVIVNEVLARQLWPERDPVGRRIRFGGADSSAPWLTVTGVVADLRRQGPEHAPVAQAFQPYAQRPSRGAKLVIAGEFDAGNIAAAVRRVVAEEDRAVPVGEFSTLRGELQRSLEPRRFTLGMIRAFAFAAVALAGIGAYGLISYAVNRQTQEIGIRMALGAQPRDILTMVLRDGLRFAAIGIAIGTGASLLCAPLLRSLLFETGAFDPLTFAGAVLLLLGVAVAACVFPARRAMSVDPQTALRAD